MVAAGVDREPTQEFAGPGVDHVDVEVADWQGSPGFGGACSVTQADSGEPQRDAPLNAGFAAIGWRCTLAKVERRHKIPGPDGQVVDAVEVGFRTSGEHWNEYLLDDGTVLRLKVVSHQIFRVEGQFDEMGNPAYLIRSQNVVSASSPENLRRQP